jgi:hypothetical protein
MYPHGPQGHRIEVCHDMLVRAGQRPPPPPRVQTRQWTEAEYRQAQEALDREMELERTYSAERRRLAPFREQLDAAQSPQAAVEVLHAVAKADVKRTHSLHYELARDAWRRFGRAVKPTHDLVIFDDRVDGAPRVPPYTPPLPLGRDCRQKQRLPMWVFASPGLAYKESIGFLTPMGAVLVPFQFPDGILRRHFIDLDREWRGYGAPAVVIHGHAAEIDFVKQPGRRRLGRPLRRKVARLVGGVAFSFGWESNHSTPLPAAVASALVGSGATMSGIHEALSPAETPPTGWGQPQPVGRCQ